MQRFFVEVPHESTALGCTRAVDVFLKTGSHFFTHAGWGCKDGEHKAWAFVEADGRDEALAVVPPAYRSRARVVRLHSFTRDEIDDLLREHET